MILLSKPVICEFSHVFEAKSPQFCPCSCQLMCLNRDRRRRWYKEKYWAFNSSSNRVFRACVRNSDGNGHNFNVEVANSARLGANSIVLRRFSDELGSNDGGRVLSKEGGMQLGSGFANLDNNSNNDDNSDSDRVRELSRDDNLQLGSGFTNLDNNDDNRDSDRVRELSRDENLQLGSGFTHFQQDPIVDKLRTQLGVIHPIPSPPISKNVFGLFVLFFFIGVVTDKIWNRLKRKKNDAQLALWRQTPTSVSMLLEKDLQRKESVEWVNMVLGKLWKVYKPGLENWIVGLLQPVIDDLKKPDYVERVEVKQFSLGDEPLSVRSVERRTSRRVNDLQYQIGLRYTGGARMLLMLTLKFGILPVMVPVGVQDFDIDGELWVKLRLIPTEPWVGAVQWAFVTLPKVTFELSPFRLFNLMTIPVLSMFLTKLLTKDLPKLFVRPNKIVLDFQEGKAVGPVAKDFKPSDVQEKNKDFVGELSVTLVDARNLSYVIYGKTDPYVVLRLGDQTIRSKKNSQTTVIGPPGEPFWNQDFNMLVQNPQNQKLKVEVVDSLGFMNVSTGTAEVDLSTLQDTVVTDKIVVLTGGWNLLRKGNSGEILVRLTYRAYVEDEEDEGTKKEVGTAYVSEDDSSDTDEPEVTYKKRPKISMSDLSKDSFMDVLAALIVSEEFQGIVASEAGNGRVGNNVTSSAKETPKSSQVESVSSGDGKTSKGSAVFWLAVITIVAVVIALNVGGSSVFNP